MFIYAWLVMLFLLGLCVGSFLNVCIARLPWEKNLLWPASHCGSCFQAIRWYDNLPLASYLLLRGKCRTCGARFSFRYFFIELFTGLAFAGLFYLIAIVNIHDFEALQWERQNIEWGRMPSWTTIVTFFHHAWLLALLIIIFFCDLDHMEIPLSVTLFGTGVGLLFAVLWPWPWPWTLAQAAMPADPPWWLADPAKGPRQGLYPWPVWGPPPDWLPPGSWQLGLATGIVGAVVAALLLRLIRFLFSAGLGIEAMGLGDADLMMMAGAFLGWQPVAAAFFLSAFPGLVFGVSYLAIQGMVNRRKIQVVLRLDTETSQPTLVLEGTTLAEADLAPALAKLGAERLRKGVIVDITSVDELVDGCLRAIRAAAHKTVIRHVHLEEQRVHPDVLMALVHLFLSWVRQPAKAVAKVEVVHDGNGVAFRVGDVQVAAPQLANQLRKAVKPARGGTLLVSLAGLDHWSGNLAAKVHEAARQAGAADVQLGERGFPFGPALAVGIVLAMLCWRWIGPAVQPLFFNDWMLLSLTVVGGTLMFGMSYVLRLLRRGRTALSEEEAETAEPGIK